MKSVLIATLLVLASPFIHAQYQPVTHPETIYAVLNDAKKVWNVGTDTRAANPGDNETSGPYLNFLNVTVSDHHEIMGAPRFYWNGSGLSGPSSQILPSDATDPDVVLIDNPGFNVYALVVYHSNSIGGYCYSYSRFTGTTFVPLSMPTLLEPYVNAPADQICINIDSDESGNFAVVYQKGYSTISKTGTFPAGSAPPPVPGSPKIYENLIQSDVAVQHAMPSTATKIKIIGLTTDRSKYGVYMQNIAGAVGYSYVSPAYPPSSLYTPRIACPFDASPNYAITMMKNVPGSGIYDIMLDVSNGASWLGIRTVNNGSIAGFPPAINNYINQYPALAIVNSKIVLGWHTEVLPGPPAIQKMTFTGLDINTSTMQAVSGNKYLDISPSPYVNEATTIGIAGRYCQWGKTAAYERTDPNSAQSGTRLVYSLAPMGLGTWSSPHQVQEHMTVAIYPNPVKEVLHIQLPETNTSYTYSIIDMLGRRVLAGGIDQSKAQISMGELPAGNYTLILEQEGAHKMYKLQFIKQ